MTLSLELLKTSGHENWPEEFDGLLERECIITRYSICCSFNRKGTLLAVGCNDGNIVIWDFQTRITTKSMLAHAGHPVCSVDWSRNSRKLVSCSMDSTVAVWDVLTQNTLIRYRLLSPIIKAQFHPRNDKLILACPVKHAPILLEIDYPIMEDVVEKPASVRHKILPNESESGIVASFDKRGLHIFTGNTKGKILIYKSPTSLESEKDIEIISSFSIGSEIREIDFSAHSKGLFLINSSDRAIRIFDCKSALGCGPDGTCGEIRKIQDSVSKTTYHRCKFSRDPSANYLCVANQNSIQIYDTETGSVIKIIPGETGEKIIDLQLHPLRPIAVSIAAGSTFIWVRPQIENWSAYAPEFHELEENMDYDERESEFDEEDEDSYRKKKIEIEKVELDEVDVDTVQPPAELISSDEEMIEDCLDFIPVTIDDQDLIENLPLEIVNTTATETQQKGNSGQKKRGPQKGSKNQKTEGSLKRPRSGEKLNKLKKKPD